MIATQKQLKAAVRSLRDWSLYQVNEDIQIAYKAMRLESQVPEAHLNLVRMTHTEWERRKKEGMWKL